VYRPGYPASFYAILHAVGIGTRRQTILDLGTGTGVLARAFAKQGVFVIGIDISEAHIAAAYRLALQEHLTVYFATCAAEEIEFYSRFFETISCGQSWRYLDQQRMIPLVKTWLKPGGRIRACRAIGAALPPDEVERFDQELDVLSSQMAWEALTIVHQI
jgi:2-polyprenyl-3-methyl-5-hydroxy-6-metoxy-1,4-benzoquinol methylase